MITEEAVIAAIQKMYDHVQVEHGHKTFYGGPIRINREQVICQIPVMDHLCGFIILVEEIPDDPNG